MEAVYEKKRFETILSVDELIEKYYDFSTTFRKCSQCPGFAGTWSCPDFTFDPLEYWKQFTHFHFIVDRVSNEGATTPREAQDRLFAEKKVYDKEMLELEATSPGSRSLAAQECCLCKKCARAAGIPCLHPEAMRYALESLGMLAVRMVPDCFGFDVLWSDGASVPEYYILAGGLLTKRKYR